MQKWQEHVYLPVTIPFAPALYGVPGLPPLSCPPLLASFPRAFPSSPQCSQNHSFSHIKIIIRPRVDADIRVCRWCGGVVIMGRRRHGGGGAAVAGRAKPPRSQAKSGDGTSCKAAAAGCPCVSNLDFSGPFLNLSVMTLIARYHALTGPSQSENNLQHSNRVGYQYKDPTPSYAWCHPRIMSSMPKSPLNSSSTHTQMPNPHTPPR